MRNIHLCRAGLLALVLILCGFSPAAPARGQAPDGDAAGCVPRRAMGQKVYVPVYSHIYFGDRFTPFLLTATVLVRNTDPRHSILVWEADYHDSDGKLLQRYLTEPTRLLPLASLRFIVPESESAGGAGASVLVTWKSSVPVNPPIVESVMIGTRNQQGVSFTSRGQVLDVWSGEPTPPPASAAPLAPAAAFPPAGPSRP
ncbi:MAG: DUF3124 domain-containing protein [Candidatus Riflebacteria bacterium]|nr:DUF3124 domain-containing protein [Candidatus Riflebacteria bacterium]